MKERKENKKVKSIITVGIFVVVASLFLTFFVLSQEQQTQTTIYNMLTSLKPENTLLVYSSYLTEAEADSLQTLQEKLKILGDNERRDVEFDFSETKDIMVIGSQQANLILRQVYQLDSWSLGDDVDSFIEVNVDSQGRKWLAVSASSSEKVIEALNILNNYENYKAELDKQRIFIDEGKIIELKSSCESDTDNGYNLFTKGKILPLGLEDECVEGKLIEYGCIDGKLAKYELDFNCVGGRWKPTLTETISVIKDFTKGDVSLTDTLKVIREWVKE